LSTAVPGRVASCSLGVNPDLIRRFSLVLPTHALRRLVASCACLLTLVSAHPVAAAAAAVPTDVPENNQLVNVATQYVGTPYRFGGASPAGFDCTGFVMFVYSQFGISLPRNEAGQLNSGPQVSPDDLQPGDVVVFANTYRAGLSHTGIYVGDGKFVHAANERTGVIISNLWDSYWGPRFVGASRALA
jgi:cell wall-associated NlpC family hydrolase